MPRRVTFGFKARLLITLAKILFVTHAREESARKPLTRAASRASHNQGVHLSVNLVAFQFSYAYWMGPHRGQLLDLMIPPEWLLFATLASWYRSQRQKSSHSSVRQSP
jgi:predicted amidohydrolase